MAVTSKKKTGRARRDRTLLIDKALRVLEFAWGTGVLDLNPDEFAACMETLFPDKFGTERAVQKRIEALTSRTNRLFGRDALD